MRVNRSGLTEMPNVGFGFLYERHCRQDVDRHIGVQVGLVHRPRSRRRGIIVDEGIQRRHAGS